MKVQELRKGSRLTFLSSVAGVSLAITATNTPGYNGLLNSTLYIISPILYRIFNISLTRVYATAIYSMKS